MIERSANPGVGMVEGENEDLGPGIPASLAQHLQEHGVHCRVLEQDGKVVTSDHKYCGGDDGCDVGRGGSSIDERHLTEVLSDFVEGQRWPLCHWAGLGRP